MAKEESRIGCTLCDHCKIQIKPPSLRENTSGKYYVRNGKACHKECWEEYTQIVCERCLHCNDPILPVEGRFGGEYIMRDNGQVHKECWDKFVQSEAAAPPPSSSSNKDTETPSSGLGRLCSECHKPIAVLPNQFSGKYVELSNGVVVHDECYVTYRNTKMERCIQCQEPIAKIPEKGFSGGFCCIDTETKSQKGKIHVECRDAYRALKLSCVHCKKPIYEHGTFSGQYHIIDKEYTVHKECREGFTEQLMEQQAEKCVDCGKGIRPGGQFSGAYYVIGRGHKIHKECR